jgi:hypothetical protein
MPDRRRPAAAEPSQPQQPEYPDKARKSRGAADPALCPGGHGGLPCPPTYRIAALSAAAALRAVQGRLGPSAECVPGAYAPPPPGPGTLGGERRGSRGTHAGAEEESRQARQPGTRGRLPCTWAAPRAQREGGQRRQAYDKPMKGADLMRTSYSVIYDPKRP